MKKIAAKFPSKCRECGAAIEVGSMFWFDPDGGRGQRSVCLSCHKPKAEPKKAEEGEKGYGAAEPLVHEGTTETLLGGGMRWHDSLQDLLDAARRPSHANLREWTNREISPPDSKWFGLPTVEDVRKAVAEGWTEGVKRMEENFGQIEVDIAATSKRRRRRYADQGDELNMNRVWSGQIDRAWQRTFRENRAAPRNITLAIDLPITCGNHADELFWKGAAALFLADRLTASGFNVEVIALSALRQLVEKGEDQNGLRAVKIKSADAPLDLSSMTAAICLAGFWRHYVLQADTSEIRPLHHAHGLPSTARQIAPEHLAELNAIDGFGQVASLEGATLFVREVLEQIERGELHREAA